MSSLTSVGPSHVADNIEDRVYRKATARIVPILIAAFLAAYIDRVNVGFAKLQMAADLNFSDAVYGLGAGVFFFGYFLFELPSNLILHRVGARVWLARIMITWGLISAATMLVQTDWQFYGMRFALGAAEAGFMPGVIYFLSSWFPAQRRGRVVGLFFIGLGMAGFIGGPVSGLILKELSGAWGYAGWRWLFAIEALPSILIGLLLFFVLQDRVADASWLSAEEKAVITADLERERAAKPGLTLAQALVNPLIILMTVIFFICNLCIYGLNFWLPTLIVNMGVQDPVVVGFASALPSLCGICTMILVSRSSDLRRERRWHLAGLYLCGAVGLALSVVFEHEPVPGIAALCIATAGILSIPPLFWNLPTALLSGVAAAGALAVLNSFANLSGFFGPAIVGWTATATGGTQAAILFLAATLVLAAGLIFLIPARLVNR
jgi:MFS family permease